MPRPTPQPAAKPLVAAWASGLPLKIDGRKSIHDGMFLDTGTDAALDDACAAAEWQRGLIQHGSANPGQSPWREHWLVPDLAPVHVMISGVPYMSVRNLADNYAQAAAHGIACLWPKTDTGRSVLAVQLLWADLLALGYQTPIPFVVRSNRTTELLTALLAHNDAIDRAEQALGQGLDYWQIAMPIKAGEETTTRGNGDASKDVTPLFCGHPAQLTRKYIEGLKGPIQLHTLWLEQENEIRRWAVSFVEREMQRQGQPARPDYARATQ